MTRSEEVINLATFYHNYGFHRSEGGFPGKRLGEKLKPIVEESQRAKRRVVIDLNEMRAFYGSFIDGAFGLFMDELGDQFFDTFEFISNRNPSYSAAVSRVFQRHKAKDFNRNLQA